MIHPAYIFTCRNAGYSGIFYEIDPLDLVKFSRYFMTEHLINKKYFCYAAQ